MSILTIKPPVVGRVNQLPKPTFQLAKLQDPVAQQNFEILSRELNRLHQGGVPKAANIVFSSGLLNTDSTQFADTNEHRIAQLSCQITTSGNPVSVKLSPAMISNNSTYDSILNIGNITPPADAFSNKVTFGWYRSVIGGADGSPVCISRQFVSNSVTFSTPAAGNTIALLYNYLQLPAFEIEDPVSTGTYLYQFFLQCGSNTFVTLNQVQVIARELS